MKKLRFWAINLAYLMLSISVIGSSAQANTCATLVAQALGAVDTNCGGLGRNTVCYGHNRVDATFFNTVDENTFSAPADRTDLLQVSSLQTAPLDTENNQWGVAVMNVQANVPNTLPGQAVTFLLLGSTRLENAIWPEEAFTAGEPVRVFVTAFQRVNVRSGPGTSFNVSGNAESGQLLDVDARNATGDWLRISGTAPYNWISRALIDVQTGSDSQLSALPIAPENPQSPMQAFYFRTGVGAPTCEEAPDLLVVQGPKDVRVSLTINGAEVALGSTIVFQSGETTYGALKDDTRIGTLVNTQPSPDEAVCLFTEMSVIEGDALANNGELFVPLGHWAKSATCLDENRMPAFTTEFGGVREMTDEEMSEFSIVERITLPHYQVEMPSQEAIQESIRNGPDPKPAPTPLPILALERPTSVPVTPQATPSGTASCGNFSPSAPMNTANTVQVFSWTPAQNVAAYQLEIAADYGGFVPPVTKLFRTGANNTSMTINFNEFNTSTMPSQVYWMAQALVYDSAGNLTSLCDSHRVAVSFSH